MTALNLAAQLAAAALAVSGLTFLTPEGQTVTLAEVVGDRPTVLVFLRHFG